MLNNVTRVDKNWQRNRGEDPTACTQQLDEIYDDNALDNALTSSEESCAREREREKRLEYRNGNKETKGIDVVDRRPRISRWSWPPQRAGKQMTKLVEGRQSPGVSRGEPSLRDYIFSHRSICLLFAAVNLD